MRTALDSLCVAGIVALLTAQSALGQCEQQILYSPDANVDDSLGVAVGISGDTLIVGAHYDDQGAFNSGAAYIYRRVNGVWAFEQKLIASDPGPNEVFGLDVAIDGDFAIVGSFLDQQPVPNGGSAHVYQRVNGVWSHEAKLVPNTPTRNIEFAYSVDLDANRALIGAVTDGDPNGPAGAAYVFRRAANGSWTQEARIAASSAESDPNAAFGSDVALDGEYAIVGARLDDATARWAGAAYAFRRIGTTWTPQGQLLASDGQAIDEFGNAVAIDGDAAVIGAFADDGANGFNLGSAYIFRRSGSLWSQEAKIQPNDLVTDANFGISVDIEGDTVVVGAYLDDNPANYTGAAYVYRHVAGAWVQEQKIVPGSAAADDRFGAGVAISGSAMVVGAYGVDSAATNAGAAFVYDVDGDCNHNGVCDDQESFPGDVNGDLNVDLGDVSLLLAAYGACEGDPDFNAAADFNDSGCVDLSDLSVQLGNYGETLCS